VNILLVGFRTVEEIWMILLQALPLSNLLIEAKVAARARAPSVVRRSTDPGALKDTDHAGQVDLVVPERVDGHDVRSLREHWRFFRLISCAVFVPSNPDITEGVGLADKRLKRLNLQNASTPPCSGVRQEVTVNLAKPDIERGATWLLSDIEQIQRVESHNR